MHQGHNIPWDLISSNFKFVRDDKRFTPPFTGLVSLDKPNTTNELKHLMKKIAGTIPTFSETERKKYQRSFTPLLTVTLFSDELRDRYPEYLNKRNQKVEHWIERAYKSDAESRYDTRDAELADVVKVLLYENEMTSLLMLAQHPRVPIHTLTHLSWGHHFGFSRVMESALQSYMFFNAVAAMDMLENGAYMELPEYGSIVRDTMFSMDYPAQQIPHRLFFQQCGMKLESITYENVGIDVAVHGDYGRLREHLKLLFALMYRYDLLLRESDLDPDWENQLVYSFPLRAAVRVE
ncbi:hypothetical protein M413DRAFT_449768 [Hebeloma cylindrosporum]|uniref:Uncharacterized protein n=1 Tax=Hebeloma cylindrosporum TaxID=76867 RepID=A0A0C3BVF5_HEBCY|nr:hypothetical protein M413DRAFT_449768 [Hebeloma cylindrosporum h7]